MMQMGDLDDSSIVDENLDTTSQYDETEDIEVTETSTTESPTEKAVESKETLARKETKNTKPAKRRCAPPDQLKTINAMASTATKVLTQIASKNAKQERTTESAGDDKDWDFCKFIYHKMKDVPDGDEKEDMQLSIQQIIAETKRKV
jgi:hypothetical protein